MILHHLLELSPNLQALATLEHSLIESTEAIILNTLLLHDKRTCKVLKDAQYASAEDAGRGTSSKAPRVHPI